MNNTTNNTAQRNAHTVSYGEGSIDYELLRTNRKTLEIAVHPSTSADPEKPADDPGGISVVVKAPLNASMETIEGRVRKKAKWIKRQITHFKQFDPRTPPRRYVGGESHLYLGRKYRLKIAQSSRDQIVLRDGYFFIDATRKQPEHIKSLMEAWYKAQAKTYLAGVFDECWEMFKNRHRDKLNGRTDAPHLRLRRMGTRWGSLSRRGQLTLNPSLIQAPKECIEYVVIHELCHLIHHHHGPAFYKLLDLITPDWPRRKQRLEMALV